MDQTIYAALASRITANYQKSENFENITFFPKIYNSVTKNLCESKKMRAEEKENFKTFYESKRNKMIG